MNKDIIILVGLDTHKTFHHAAYVQDGRGKTPVDYGKIDGSKSALTRFLRRLQSKFPGPKIHAVYEAGPCGFWIYRHITSLGHRCFVVSPSKIPKAPGDRVKTDRRDAMKLAKLLKSEDLTHIYVPEEEDEVVRDLSRLREVAMLGNKRVKGLLTEGAHSYKHPASISREMQVRLEGLPRAVLDIGWKAKLRLCRRYKRLYAKGKHRNLVVTAIAREMASYM